MMTLNDLLLTNPLQLEQQIKKSPLNARTFSGDLKVKKRA
jgi:hypothetical protein